jgi:hypothetical protein
LRHKIIYTRYISIVETFGCFLTRTTYGTWRPGDPRRWVAAGEYVIHAGDAQKEGQSCRLLHGEPITLRSE